jgi:hypothetical protein
LSYLNPLGHMGAFKSINLVSDLIAFRNTIFQLMTVAGLVPLRQWEIQYLKPTWGLNTLLALSVSVDHCHALQWVDSPRGPTKCRNN